MKYTILGNTLLPVSKLCLGGNVFGWTVNPENSSIILDEYFNMGGNFIDTADVYSRWASGVGGESETIIGDWMCIKKNRSKIVLATKVGMDMGQGKTDVSKKYILKAAEASLKRLRTDYIDLYQTHKDDESISASEALEAYDLLIRQGKVRFIGASNFSPKRLYESFEISSANKLPVYQTLQPLYNLYDRAVFENELEKVCMENKLAVLSYFSLASGFLTGKYRPHISHTQTQRSQRVTRYLNNRGFKIVNTLECIAKKHTVSCSSVALAWLLSKPVITAPIASATNLEQLDSLVSGVDMTLDPEDLNLLDEVSREE